MIAKKKIEYLKACKSAYIIVVLLFGTLILNAQYTKIIGKIIDASTNEPLPFVNVYLQGTSVGATTGFDGKFSIKTKVKADTLVASYVGYIDYKTKIKRGAFQEFEIKLQTSNVTLAEVVIHPTENPAHILLRKVIANKEKNNSRDFDYYQVKIYNKIQFDANNITDEFKKKRVFKPFEFVFEHVDTSALNGKTYLPLMLTESVSDFYYRKSPEFKKEIIKASRASGIKNESISLFLGNMYQQVNVYDNYIGLFNKNFASPIANFGRTYYRYYLVDSAVIDGHWCYKMMFKPKRKKELTFTGEIWIADTSFAVKSVKMKIVEDLNINYINAMAINQEFNLVDGKYWVLTLDKFLVDFNVVDNNKKLTGFYAHKTTRYDDYVINKPAPKSIYNSATYVDMDPKAYKRNENFWDSIRPVQLNEEEQTIYKMVDTITNLPAFRTYYDVIALITTGYYNTEYIDWGPYFQTISYNAVEGLRLRVGGRTSNKWNQKLRLYGHIAYGLKDNKFKYGAGVLYLTNRNPRRGFGMEYKKDMEQLGESVNALKQDNIIASVLRRRPFTKLTFVEQYKAHYEHEWFNGFSNKITFRRRRIYPLEDEQFIISENKMPKIYDRIVTSEIEFNLRFAYKETYLIDKFNRKNLGTKFPVINLWYSYGIPRFLGSQFTYHKLTAAIQHKFNVGGIGWSRYIIAAGKIWGKLPYPLLKIHPGNETYSFDKYAFNKMNYYEFISDEYLAFYYSHHFDGFFLNHIPLMRALEWREVVYFKGLFGRMSEKNRDYSKFPDNAGWLTGPYYEAGVAVENIFKVLRVDAGWRLSYLDHPDILKFGLMATLYLSF